MEGEYGRVFIAAVGIIILINTIQHQFTHLSEYNQQQVNQQIANISKERSMTQNGKKAIN
jgi:hypothetical protein